MARGGKGGHRGGSRGKGSGFAQSGGKSTTFGGGKGGNAYGNKSTTRQVKGSGGLRPSNTYTIVAPGGDNVSVGSTGKARKAKNLPQGPKPKVGGASMFDHKKAHVNKPVKGGH